MKCAKVSPVGRLAQLVEHPVYTGMVRGSSPLSPTTYTKRAPRRSFCICAPTWKFASPQGYFKFLIAALKKLWSRSRIGHVSLGILLQVFAEDQGTRPRLTVLEDSDMFRLSIPDELCEGTVLWEHAIHFVHAVPPPGIEPRSRA